MTLGPAYPSGSVPSDNFFGGSFDVADTATTATPISIPGTNTFIKLTNNGLGTQTTNANAPIGITELWNTTNDEFDFSQLKLGDVVEIRLDVNVITASPNTQVQVRLQAGIGVSAFSVGWDNQFYGTAVSSPGTPLVRSSFVAMQTTTILTGTAEFQLAADKACTVVVNGWNYIVTRRG